MRQEKADSSPQSAPLEGNASNDFKQTIPKQERGRTAVVQTHTDKEPAGTGTHGERKGEKKESFLEIASH
jgi:hypothetical protein